MKENYNYYQDFEPIPVKDEVSVESEKVKEEKPSKVAKAVVTCFALNVRSDSDIESSVIEVVDNGVELEVLGGGKTVNGFISVKTPNGHAGYVMKQFVNIK